MGGAVTDLPQMALSLRQPWCVFMLDLPPEFRKTLENRDWNTSFRGDVWVHSSKGVTKLEFYEACEFALNAGVPRDLLPSFDGLKRGGIVGRWTIVDVMRPNGLKLDGRKLVDHARKGDRWHMPDQFGIIVENARAVPFVECRGALGFWRVPADVLANLSEST
jgi:hypothetical protein